MYEENYTNCDLENRPEDDLLTEAAIATEEPEMPEEKRPATRKKKAKSNGTLIFYSIYLTFVLLALCALILLMTPLHNWLVKFEASQPDHQCQQVYNILFADPDWAVLYDLAKVEDTDFEGKDDYVRYMEAKVQKAKNPELTYHETSAGLSGDRKYIVKLDEEKVATFTLYSTLNPASELNEWNLGNVELFFERTQSVTVERLPGYTVFINNIALDDSYTVRNIYTRAEDYLPDGVHGYCLQQQYVTDLLMHPESVEVIDASGNNIPLIYDEQSNTYMLDLPKPAEMTEEEANIVLDAAKANALFAIRAIKTGDLRKYFDPNTQIYEDICNTPTFIQSYDSYSFDESAFSVSEFYRYTDSLFSARVTLKLNVVRNNGTVKNLEMDTTYLLTKNAMGTYLVTNITNVALQQVIDQVRLSFEQDGRTVCSMFVDTASQSITLPQIEAPEGQVLSGWATKTLGENNQVTMTILFAPDENSTAPVPEDLMLEPMTLYAVFEKAEAVE